MAVMTHARTQPTSVDYRDLTALQQARLDQAMQTADHAATGETYREAMTDAATAAGIPLPASRDLAVCDCLNHGCGCGAIFDSHLRGVVVTANADPDYSLSRLQCPDCGHDHPRPIAD